LAGGLGAPEAKGHFSLMPVTQTSHSKTQDVGVIESSKIQRPLKVNSRFPSTYQGRPRQNICGEMQAQWGEHWVIPKMDAVLSA